MLYLAVGIARVALFAVTAVRFLGHSVPHPGDELTGLCSDAGGVELRMPDHATTMGSATSAAIAATL